MRDKNLKILLEGALMVALSFGLSWFKLFQAPFGGTVTLGSMVPVLLFSFRHGPKYGFMAGVAHGLLQIVADPYIVHPVQVLLDYPVAFGLLGTAGFFPTKTFLGSFVGIGGRFASHFLSGVIFFASSGIANAAVYSLSYNAGYLIPELFISFLVLRLVLKPFLKAGQEI